MLTLKNNAVWLAVGAAAVLAIYFINPSQTHLLPSCPFHTLTGLYCPGCGSTRALHQLAHGNLAAAFQFNPLAVTVLPLVGGLLLLRQAKPIRPWLLWTFVSLIIIFGVLRNIPQYPFTLLTPHL